MRRSTHVSLKGAIAAQGVDEPLKCDGKTISLTDIEHSFGLASRCCDAGFSPSMSGKAVPSDGMVFPIETVDNDSLFDRGRGGA